MKPQQQVTKDFSRKKRNKKEEIVSLTKRAFIPEVLCV